MRLIIATLLGLCACLCPGALRAQSAVHPLTILLETSSDWAHLDVHGLQLRTLRREVSVAGDVDVPNGGLSLHKPAGDPTPASLRATCEALAIGDAVEFVLTRGDMGKTRVRVWAGNALIVDVQQEGALPGLPQNRVAIPVELDKVLRAPALPRRALPRRVLAFYYGWYGTPNGPAHAWFHWVPDSPHHGAAATPQLGLYDSADKTVIRQQVAWAREAGIEGFVLSLWPGDPYGELVLKNLLEVVQGTDFLVSVYLESAKDAEHLRTQIEDIAGRLGSHANWLRQDSKPVLFLYSRIVEAWPAAAMRTALRESPAFVIGDTTRPELAPLFDGTHTYVNAAWPEPYRRQLLAMRAQARLHDKLLCATVVPGYDDTRVRAPGLLMRRDEGRFYARTWSTATLADWVLISTWNEWHEGTQLEPSVEEGRLWIERTREAIRRWRGGP